MQMTDTEIKTVDEECCRNCGEWSGFGFNLEVAFCNALEKQTDAWDWCHEYRKAD